MPRDRTRRRLLKLTGTATAASLAGCASVVNQFPTGGQTEASGDTPGNGEREMTGQPAASATPDGSSETPSEKRVSSKSQSGSNESDGGDSWSTRDVTIDEPDVAFSGIPVPEQRSRYARMGHDDASVTATLYGNWKCPYTQEFVLNMLPEVVDRFVDPGDLAVEYRSLAYLSGEPFLGTDAPRASRTGLAVWDIDPRSYWSYFAHVFANQPQERYEWAQPSLLLRFAEAAGVPNRSQLRRSIASGTYAGPVQSTTGAAADRNITTVPRIAVDGTVTAPTVDFQQTLSQLERAIRA